MDTQPIVVGIVLSLPAWVTLYFVLRAWKAEQSFHREERADLINRIQARTLQEHAISKTLIHRGEQPPHELPETAQARAQDFLERREKVVQMREVRVNMEKRGRGGAL